MTQDRDKNRLGKAGEVAAINFLKNHGYQILEQNYRLKIGEIDIIAKNRDTICFVEVKARTSASHGQPFEAVSKAKQRKISQVALYYLSQKDLMSTPARFDVVAVSVDDKGDFVLDLLKNAFDVMEPGF